jgi:carboxy-cis,cis-muconate cyclase
LFHFPSFAFPLTQSVAATSSYISVTDIGIYSAGGPTAEFHHIDPSTGGFGEKAQQLLFVDEEALPREDKTRVALVRALILVCRSILMHVLQRYGSHGFDLSSRGHAFIPHL